MSHSHMQIKNLAGVLLLWLWSWLWLWLWLRWLLLLLLLFLLLLLLLPKRSNFGISMEHNSWQASWWFQVLRLTMKVCQQFLHLDSFDKAASIFRVNYCMCWIKPGSMGFGFHLRSCTLQLWSLPQTPGSYCFFFTSNPSRVSLPEWSGHGLCCLAVFEQRPAAWNVAYRWLWSCDLSSTWLFQKTLIWWKFW